MTEVVRDDRVDVRQGYRGVLLGDLLSGGAGVESGQQRVQGHPGATDPDHAVGVGLNRDPLRRRVQFHEASVGGTPKSVNLCASSRPGPRNDDREPGFQRANTRLSLRWSRRHTAAVWLKRHGKRPRGVSSPVRLSSSHASRGQLNACHASTRRPLLSHMLALTCESAAAPARRRAAVCAARDPDSDRKQDVSDPGSETPNPSRPRRAGSLTSCLRVWQPPTLSSAASAWSRSRGRIARAAPTGRHVGRHPVGQPCADRPRPSYEAIAIHRGIPRCTGLAAHGRCDRRANDGSDSEWRPLAMTRPSSLPLVGMTRGDPSMVLIEVVWLEEHGKDERGRTLPPHWRYGCDVAGRTRGRRPRAHSSAFRCSVPLRRAALSPTRSDAYGARYFNDSLDLRRIPGAKVTSARGVLCRARNALSGRH